MKTKLNLPSKQSHKGQNGKLLVIGGSRLFHAASLWSAQIAAHLVDMVFYASTSENNRFAKTAKSNFRDGIVIEREQIIAYAQEADVILLGPGLTRSDYDETAITSWIDSNQELTPEQWQSDTALITNWLLAHFPDKKFVLDAGALQMLSTRYLTPACILTPHQGEWQRLQANANLNHCQEKLQAATILSKDTVDKVWQAGIMQASIAGGNGGLTKGGSGDVLAGTVAGLYCYNNSIAACEWASRALKASADKLYRTYGPFFTTTQLSEALPATLWELINA